MWLQMMQGLQSTAEWFVCMSIHKYNSKCIWILRSLWGIPARHESHQDQEPADAAAQWWEPRVHVPKNQIAMLGTDCQAAAQTGRWWRRFGCTRISKLSTRRIQHRLGSFWRAAWTHAGQATKSMKSRHGCATRCEAIMGSKPLQIGKKLWNIR